MMNRLASLEDRIEKFKDEIDVLKTKNTKLEANVNSLSESVANNFDHSRDLPFLVD